MSRRLDMEFLKDTLRQYDVSFILDCLREIALAESKNMSIEEKEREKWLIGYIALEGVSEDITH